MKHPSSRALYAYWDRLRAGRAAPERGELDPGAIRTILGDVMILEVGGPHRYAVRLAGTRICSLMGRELRARAFVETFAPGDWPELYALLDFDHGNRDTRGRKRDRRDRGQTAPGPRTPAIAPSASRAHRGARALFARRPYASLLGDVGPACPSSPRLRALRECRRGRRHSGFRRFPTRAEFARFAGRTHLSRSPFRAVFDSRYGPLTTLR